jgi:hypothetical protein
LTGEHAGRFGEFDNTGIGADLTLEWDSSDPDLHSHLMNWRSQEGENEIEDLGWDWKEAGIPDA